MESKQILAIIVVVMIVGVGVTFSLLSSPEPTDNTNQTDTTTDDNENGNTFLMIPRDEDLLQYDIEVPDWTFTITDGTNITPSDLRGKVVVLDFFATWCPACEIFNNDLLSLHEEYGDEIHIISLSTALADTPEKLIEYRDERELTWRFGINYGQAAADYLDIRYIPTPVIIDADGMLRWIHEGTWRFVEMNQTISDIMQ